MCEKCLEEATSKIAELDTLQKAYTPRVIDFVNGLLTENPLLGAPATAFALAVALGALIGKAPEEIRTGILEDVVQDIVKSLNAVRTDGKQINVLTGTGPLPPELEGLVVRPPVLH